MYTVYVFNMMNQLMGQGDKELSDLLDFSAVSIFSRYFLSLTQLDFFREKFLEIRLEFFNNWIRFDNLPLPKSNSRVTLA